ncbi:unnamed protein product [Ceratitis capitata]|uniref:(Mediterranean fruit fly) hypothetical protein n=1 Tax=Ceratitis capitata TaxID=7213 RepID=A0A811VA29_CERCA|nr:unnamed protein product [Ceratitis capitata]
MLPDIPETCHQRLSSYKTASLDCPELGFFHVACFQPQSMQDDQRRAHSPSHLQRTDDSKRLSQTFKKLPTSNTCSKLKDRNLALQNSLAVRGTDSVTTPENSLAISKKQSSFGGKSCASGYPPHSSLDCIHMT